jgi:hypothetical protein
MSGLTPGPYYLALSKPGYEVLLAQINTRWISRLTLTLIPGQPAIPSPADARAGSMDWVLRTPRSDLLKEIAQAPATAVPASGGSDPGDTHAEETSKSDSGLSGRLPFNGEVEQWFTADPSFIGAGESASTSGRTTSMQLDGDLFGRGNWRVGGLLGALSTQGSPSSAEADGRDQGAGRFRVAMDYNVSPDDSVRFRARYDRDTFRGDSPADSPAPAAQEVKTLGYQAGWTRKMDRGSGLEMKVGFIQALGRSPGNAQSQDPVPWPPADGSLQDRRWDAGAQFGFNASSEHRVVVSAATRFYRYDQRDEGWVLAPIQSDLSTAELGQRGWSVSLTGEDAWRISSPLSLTLGLDYHRVESLRGYSALVPRIGARRETAHTLIQGQVLFRLETLGAVEQGAAISSGSAAYSAENMLGYRAEVLHRLGGSLAISGHAERNPLGFQTRDGWMSPAAQEITGDLLITDPRSVTDEIGVQVSKRIKGVEGTLGTDQGRVRGRVGAQLNGAPIQVLGEGDVQYLTLNASAAVPATLTKVRFDYRKLDGVVPADPSADPGQASRLDLTVFQQIPYLNRRLPADWRVLLAYQTLNWDQPDAGNPGGTGLPERIRRVSGGVGVRF